MRILTSNIGWKLLAGSSSVLLWTLFVAQTELATSIPVVVQYRNVPPDLEITSDAPERLLLKLRGPSSRLGASELSQTVLQVDLKNVHAPGEQTITIGERELGLPSGVDLVRVVPSQIRLAFEKRAEKTVPVEVRYSGPPAPGYRIVSQKVVPNSLKVIGPEAIVERIESVQTDAINLSSTVGNAEFRVPVFTADPHVRFESRTPFATVYLTLEKIPQL
jgi:YbbR domain-containing protein